MNIKDLKPKKNDFIINDEITAPEIRVIDDTGNMIGIVKTINALSMAKEKNLDLILIADKATPPVAKIIDFKKFLYQKEKQKKEAKKKQKVQVLKEIKLRPKIGINYLNIKIKSIIKFLNNRDKVKITISSYGRELEKKEKWNGIMEKIIFDTKDISEIEKAPTFLGAQMILILSPKK